MGVGMGLVLLLASAGLIAYLGDLIGRRIGRKRLTLFGLRPKNTAILITVATGIAIATVTMGIIFAVSRDLRVRIFGYEQTVGKLRQEAASSATAAARSKGELATAEKDLVVQRGRVAEEQRAAEAAAKARQQAERSLAEAQARYEKSAQLANQKAREAQAATERWRAAQRRVDEATQRLARIKQEVARLGAEVDKLHADAIRDIREGTQGLIERRRLADEAAAEAVRAREEAEQYRRAAAQDRQTLDRVAEATGGAVLFHQSDEVGRIQIREPNLDLATAAVQRLVRSINDAARDRGAGEIDHERLPGIVAVPLGKTEANVTIGPADYLPSLVRQVVGEGRPVWLRAQVVLNCFRGNPLYYTFRIHPDRIAFRAGAELATAEMDGSKSELAIVDQLRAFVATQVRPATDAAGMMPSLSGANEVGPAVWLPALHQIQGVGGPAVVSAIATRDIGVGDSLANAIEFRVTAKP